MAEEVTKLSLAVDSTQVKQASTELDKFAVSGKKAETAAEGLEAGSKGVGTAMAGIAAGAQKANTAQAGLAANARGASDAFSSQAVAAKRVEAAQASLAAATGKAALAQETYNRIAAQTTATQSAIASAGNRLQQAQAGQATAAAKLASAQVLLQTQTHSLGNTSRLAAFQTQQLGFQLHDFFVQVASGGNPLTALVQQGSQLSGTFGGAGAALRALGTVFTGVRIAIGGVVGAVAGIAFAMHQGAEESLALRRAIVLTGNAAGITEGQFNEMAESIAESTNTTVGSARETLQSLVASGRFSGEALDSAAKAVQTLAKATGQSRDEIITSFVRAADGPAKFAEVTNRSLNFLTAKQLEYIRTLEEQGRVQEALAFTFDALNQRTSAAAANLGTLERGWQAVKNAVSGALDAVLAFGRDTTPEKRLEQIAAQLNALATRRPNRSPDDRSRLIETLEAERVALKQTLDIQRAVATQDGKDAERTQVRVAFNRLLESSMTRQARLAKELATANALADQAGASADDRKAVLAGIRERFGQPQGDVNATARAQLQADLDAIQQALRNRNEALRAANTVFAALRQAGTLADAEAFAAQRAQVRLNADFEIAALQEENARRGDAVFRGKEAARLQIENSAKIAANLQEIGRIRGRVAADEEAITIQQEAASRRRLANQQAERLSLEQTFDAMRRMQELELSLAGSGEAERQRATARAQIEEKFRSDIARAQTEIATKRTAGGGKASADDEKEFAVRLALLRDFLAKSLVEWDANQAKVKAKQADASLGAKEAFQNYVDEARKAGKLSEQFFTNSLARLEDALVEFITTGKLNWKSLADFVVAEIVRIIIKQQIANALAAFKDSGGDGAGSAFGGFLAGLFGGARAQGGSVQAGRIYAINENQGPGEILNAGGRQYLLAAQSGRVDPQGTPRAGNMNSTTVNVTVPEGTPREVANQLAARVAQRLAMANARNN